MDFRGDEFKVPVIGRLRVSVRQVASKELADISGFLAERFEDGESIHMLTEQLDFGVDTHQVFGFETLNGRRYHTRRIVCLRGGEAVQLRLVYYYIGPRPGV